MHAWTAVWGSCVHIHEANCFLLSVVQEQGVIEGCLRMAAMSYVFVEINNRGMVHRCG